jgi:hypothetical protein
VFISAGGHQLIGDARGSVHKIKGVAGSEICIDIEQRDFSNDATTLQCVCCARADEPTTTNDAYLHDLYFLRCLVAMLIYVD